MAYMVSGNMDSGATEFQIEAAISKIFASVSVQPSCTSFWCLFQTTFKFCEFLGKNTRGAPDD